MLLSAHTAREASPWVKRWSHLAPATGRVLDLACGYGRHMTWFSARGYHVTGIDRDPQALAQAGQFGQVLHADIENAPWPLMTDGVPETFEVVVVTNYLWRPLLPVIRQSVAPGGLLLYETFAQGNETVGKPARPDFLLRHGELLDACAGMSVVAYEDGFLNAPDRFVQRIAAVAQMPDQSALNPKRYPLSLESPD